jgi:putative hydrolase of the HAD superfamily
LALAGSFEAVITSGLVGYEKPHRRMFEAAREHSIPSAPIWMIGDNLTCDCLPVHAFGARGVLVRNPPAPYDRCAPDLWGALAMVENSGYEN